MGTVADTVLSENGEVIGVVPEKLLRRDFVHQGLTELRVVGSINERKALMTELTDAFVALPGGYGTLDELFEVLTTAALNLHNKPCGLLNVEGFYDSLLTLLDHTVTELFLRPEERLLFVEHTEAGPLLDLLMGCYPKG